MHTAYQIIQLAAERTPRHPALVDDRSNRQLSYSELLAEIDTVAAGLSARGIGAGTRVATVLPGLWEHCILLLALMRLNAVPALLNHRLKPDQIAGLCRSGNVEAAVIHLTRRLPAQLRERFRKWLRSGRLRHRCGRICQLPQARRIASTLSVAGGRRHRVPVLHIWHHRLPRRSCSPTGRPNHGSCGSPPRAD